MFLINDNFRVYPKSFAFTFCRDKCAGPERDKRFEALKIEMVCRIYNLKPEEANRRLRIVGGNSLGV